MFNKNEFYTKAGYKLHYSYSMISDTGKMPLILIHGQGMCGQDYYPVCKKLSSKYTLYLVDCFGHGDSEKNVNLYRCNIIGDAISEFIQSEIKQSCVISGHSSGGILAAYVAGKNPQWVKGVLLEDPPFFNVQPGEFENTFVYQDGFQVFHAFSNQTEESEFLVYYLEHSYIFNYLGQHYFGKDWAHYLAEEAREKLYEAPGQLPQLHKVSPNSLHSFAFLNQFDFQFAESFYTGEWFDGASQEEILQAIQCPVVYLKAKTKYGKDGILWAANSEDAADRVMHLLKKGKRKTVRCGHDIHYEKPQYFMKAMKILERMMKNEN